MGIVLAEVARCPQDHLLTPDNLRKSKNQCLTCHREREAARRQGVAFSTRRRVTHCKRNHEFTPENTWVDARGSRVCRACTNAGQLVRLRAGGYRARHLSQYGLTVDGYIAILELQDGACAVCKEPPVKEMLRVDHDHESGVVRGLLCRHCNSALGFAKDSIERLFQLADYLGGQ